MFSSFLWFLLSPIFTNFLKLQKMTSIMLTHHLRCRNLNRIPLRPLCKYKHTKLYRTSNYYQAFWFMATATDTKVWKWIIFEKYYIEIWWCLSNNKKRPCSQLKTDSNSLSLECILFPRCRMLFSWAEKVQKLILSSSGF